MESRPARRRGPGLLGLLLLPWTLPLAGGQSVIHIGPPIVVSLANEPVSFGCRITHPYAPELQDVRVHYYRVDLQGHRSSEKQTGCQLNPGKENQTSTQECRVTLKLPNSSATGTYYCSISWAGSRVKGNGTFILVRDMGYREPPQDPQKLLLCSFTGLLTVLSIVGTALLLWKKALQRRETEVYSCIQNEASSAPFTQGHLSQEKLHRFKDDSEFNMVYENL
ncbi:NFAT activation molecule 1 isoform X2 [Equus quagga]|uniref:NFAT activation molecule 1 isoform X2 n=1 Tax=Equus quagga TaxID=89248 RepID=UPI001EE395E2|nr:NFAT activation molecule 1 isoform X2 [Equus quagga]